MRKLLLMLVALLIAGCAAQQPVIWDKKGGTQAEYDQHVRECKYDVAKNTQSTDPSMHSIFGQELDRSIRQRDLFFMCMESKGYTRRK